MQILLLVFIAFVTWRFVTRTSVLTSKDTIKKTQIKKSKSKMCCTYRMNMHSVLKIQCPPLHGLTGIKYLHNRLKCYKITQWSCWSLVVKTIIPHSSRGLVSKTPTESENPHIIEHSPPKKTRFGIFRCFYYICRNTVMRCCCFPFNSLNIMRYGSITCSSYRKFWILLSIERAERCIFMFGAT